MTYEGARAQAVDTEVKRVFVVSRARFGADGHLTDVLWGEVNSKSNLDVTDKVEAPVADVLDAIHDGAEVMAVFGIPYAHLPGQLFVALEHADGRETIALAEQTGSGAAPLPRLHDMPRLDA